MNYRLITKIIIFSILIIYLIISFRLIKLPFRFKRIKFPTPSAYNFSIHSNQGTFNDTRDDVLYLGYNVFGLNSQEFPDEPRLALSMEANYNNGPDNLMEINLDYMSADGLVKKRPLMFNINRKTHEPQLALATSFLDIRSYERSDIDRSVYYFPTNPDSLARFRRLLELEQGLRLTTAPQKPVCGQNARGILWFTQGDSRMGDLLEICVRIKGDDYEWKKVILE